MTRLFGVMIQLDNGRLIALVNASFRRNLWTHFYDSGQYTETETRACYTANLKFIAIVGKRQILRNLGPGLNYCLGFCVCIVFLNFSLFYFQIQ